MSYAHSQLSSPETASLSEWHVTQQWGPVGVRHARHTCRGGRSADAWCYQAEHTLGLFLSPRPFKFAHRQDSQSHTGLYSRGDLLVTPANTLLATQAEGDVHIAQIRLQDSFLRQVAEDTVGRPAIFKLSQLRHCCWQNCIRRLPIIGYIPIRSLMS